MAAKPVKITIGAVLAGSFGQTVGGAKGQLQQLGSVMGKLNSQHAGVSQMQELKQSAEELGKAHWKAQQRLNDTIKEHTREDGTRSRDGQREINRAATAAATAQQAVVRERNAIRGLRAELQAAGVNTRRLTDESVRLGSQMENLHRRTTSLARAQNAQQANRDKRGQMVGDIFGMMAVGMSLAKPLKDFAQFEGQMSRVGAVGRATSAQLQRLTQEALSLGETTRYTAFEVGQGMEFLSMAGFNALQTEQAIGGVLNVAAASGTELGKSADIISNVLSSMKMAAKDSGKVGDVLTMTLTSSNVTLESLGETMKYAAPVAQSLGMSLEVLATATGMLGNSGIQGSMAGTSLRKMMLSLVAPSKNARKSMKDMSATAEEMENILGDKNIANRKAIASLGIEVANPDGSMRDWEEILKELSLKMQGLTQKKRAEIADALVGKTGISGFLALMASMNHDETFIEEAVASLVEQLQAAKKSEAEIAIEVKKFRESTGNAFVALLQKNKESSGESARIAAKQLDNLRGDYVLFQSALSGLSINLGKSMAPMSRQTLQNMTALVGKATEFVKAYPRLTSVITTTAGAALTLGIAWKALGFAWSITKAPYLAARTQIEKLRARMALASLEAGGSVGRFGKVGAVMRSLVPPIFSVNAALLANPIVWIGAAMVGAGLLIYKYWEPLSSFFGGVFDGIGAAFAECGMSLGPLGEVFGGIADAIGDAWKWVTELLAPVKIASEEMEIFAAAGKNVGFIIGSVVKGAFDAITLPLRGLIEGYKWFKGKIDEVRPESSFDYNVGSAMGMGVVPSSMKAQPVGGRTITNNSKAEINITVPPGTDAQGVAEIVRREVERSSLYERGREMGGMYD